MMFGTPLEELQHWLQLLDLELRLGTERRHVLALTRLCGLLADKVSRDKHATPDQLQLRLQLSKTWLDLKRRVDASAPRPQQPNPRARRVGTLRVINGGRAQTAAKRR